MDLYNETTISNAIQTKWAGNTVHFAKEIDSTNRWVKDLAKEGAVHGTLAVTEFQTAGRGRFDRKWMAPEGSSVMMSLLLRPDFEPWQAPMLTLVMGLSVAQAAKETGFETSIKWPNDVVVSRKKICGILTEMSVGAEGIRFVVIGVGININTKEFPQEVADKATSLYLESGKEHDRNQFLALVMKYFEENYEEFIKTCDFSSLKEKYHGFLANKDESVRVLDPEGEFEGIALGINEKGELLVQKADGELVSVGAGEVSVRGLYSYV